jgi:hypothetical protein
MRELVDLASTEAAVDYNVFRTAEGQAHVITPLADGQFAFSGDARDGAGRPARHLWSVVDPDAMFPGPRAVPGRRTTEHDG